MDLVKIGKYIAGKRKNLGLTQKQLAESLGMSDKSVSKWERGICLPDVSVYMELCGILGISINEFLAGEDIGQEDMVKKSEDNLIQVTADSKHRQIRLKRIIAILLAAVVAAAAATGILLYRANRPQNYIEPVDPNSAEKKTAELLSGADGAFLYRYRATDRFQRLTVSVSEYQSGKLTDTGTHIITYESNGSPSEGMIVMVPDFDDFSIKLIVADESGKLSTDIPILDGVEDRSYYGRSATQLETREDIRYGREQYIAALIYDNDVLSATAMEALDSEHIPSENDYMYVFAVNFSK